MIEIHSCSYFCERPDCIKTQRDEMRDNGAYEQGEEMYKAIRRECDLKLAKFAAENAALRRGEFICQRCSLRKDSEHDTKHEF